VFWGYENIIISLRVTHSKNKLPFKISIKIRFPHFSKLKSRANTPSKSVTKSTQLIKDLEMHNFPFSPFMSYAIEGEEKTKLVKGK